MRLRCAAALLALLPFALSASAQDTPDVDSAPADPVTGATGTAAYSSTPGIGPTNSANGFTSVEGMVPLFIQAERQLFFLDVRGLLSDTGRGGFDLGGGYRWLNPQTDRVLGVNAYYDNRDTGAATFEQIST
jgi:hypothetical protein